MNVYHFDASGLVKYYVREPGSSWVRTIINTSLGSGGQQAHISSLADISIAEVAAAFAMLHRTGRIRRTAWRGAFDMFMADLTWRYESISTGQQDFFSAANLTRKHPLKAYDAVQLAVALRYQTLLVNRPPSLIFVSGDRTLLTAAALEGLHTDNPFDHIMPEDTPSSST